HALAEHPQGHVALFRPVLAAPDLTAFGGACARRGQRGRETAGNEAEARALHQGAAAERLMDKFVVGLRHDSSPKFLNLVFEFLWRRMCRAKLAFYGFHLMKSVNSEFVSNLSDG